MSTIKLNKYQMDVVEELKKDARPLLSLSLGELCSGTEFSIKFDTQRLLLPLSEFEECDLLKYLAGDPSVAVEPKED